MRLLTTGQVIYFIFNTLLYPALLLLLSGDWAWVEGWVFSIWFGGMLLFIGEEKMLVEELEGYEDYRKKVRYRLVPFVW